MAWSANNTSIFSILPQDNLHKKTTVPISVIILVSVHLTLFVMGHANIIVMFLISTVPKLRTVTNLYSFNLCYADYLYCLVLPMLSMVSLNTSWSISLVTCKLFFSLEAAGKFASVLFIMVLSVDRYLAICQPQWCKRNRTLRAAGCVCAATWTVVLIMIGPIFYYSTVLDLNAGRRQLCTIYWPSSNTGQQYILASFIVVFGLPFLIIFFCYFFVLRKLILAKSRARRLNRQQGDHYYKKVTKKILLIITFFVLCWSPFWIQNIMSVFIPFPMTPSWKIFFNVIHILPYTNCALNAFLYMFLTTEFRVTLKAFCFGPKPHNDRQGMDRKQSSHQSFRHKSNSILTYTTSSIRRSTVGSIVYEIVNATRFTRLALRPKSRKQEVLLRPPSPHWRDSLCSKSLVEESAGVGNASERSSNRLLAPPLEDFPETSCCLSSVSDEDIETVRNSVSGCKNYEIANASTAEAMTLSPTNLELRGKTKFLEVVEENIHEDGDVICEWNDHGHD